MDAFSYLSVLLSIILGLSITQVLLGYRGMLLARAQIALYPPPLIWSALVLLFAAQSWWASFGLAGHDDWNFASFCIVLLQSALLYMIAGLALPDFSPDTAISLRAHYFREAPIFHGLLLAMTLASVVKDWMIEGHIDVGANLAFHAAFGSVALSAILIRRPRYHEIVAPAVMLLVIAYVGLLFFRLD